MVARGQGVKEEDYKGAKGNLLWRCNVKWKWSISWLCWWLHKCTWLSKFTVHLKKGEHIECTTSRVNHNKNYEPCMIMMLCVTSSTVINITLPWGNVDNGRGYACLVVEGIWQICLYLLFNFSCEPKTALKYKVYFSNGEYYPRQIIPQ